jgi:hypothetical protein
VATDGNKVIVEGDGVDSVKLANSLKKKIGPVSIESITLEKGTLQQNTPITTRVIITEMIIVVIIIHVLLHQFIRFHCKSYLKTGNYYFKNKLL